VAALPIADARLRNVNDTRKLNVQFAIVHTAMAGPRISSGKISEIMSQKTGPSPTANDAM
jgi:hypothetical protein